MSYALVSQSPLSRASRKRPLRVVSTVSQRRRGGTNNSGSYKAIRNSVRGAFIPRSIREHKFVRTVSTNNGASYGNAQQIVLTVDQNRGFLYNGTNVGSFNLAFTFSLAGLNIWAAGTYQGTINVPGTADFTSLYEQYRIDYIDVMFFYSNNQSSNNQPGQTLPIFGVVRDFDDVNATDMFALQQFSGYQTWQVGNQRGDGSFKLRVKPAVQQLTYNGSGGTTVSGVTRKFSPVMSMNTSQVPHYGVKIAFDPIAQGLASASAPLGYLSMSATYHLTMKNSR